MCVYMSMYGYHNFAFIKFRHTKAHVLITSSKYVDYPYYQATCYFVFVVVFGIVIWSCLPFWLSWYIMHHLKRSAYVLCYFVSQAFLRIIMRCWPWSISKIILSSLADGFPSPPRSYRLPVCINRV